MHSKILKPVLIILLGTVLSACSSTREQDEKIAAIATHRAQILSAGLPIEHGPLTVMQAKASGKVIELMMIYNSPNGKPPKSLIDASKQYYCSHNETKTNLDQGISYLIKIRNSRGQILVEETISSASCV